MFQPILKKGSNGDNFNIFNSNPKLVVYRWKSLLTNE